MKQSNCRHFFCERLGILSGVEKAGNCAVASNCHVIVNGIQEWRNRKIFFYKVVVTSRLFTIKKQTFWGQKISLCHFLIRVGSWVMQSEVAYEM
jgi:hypothetical protein